MQAAVGQSLPLSDSRTLNVGFSAASGVLVDLSGVTANDYHKLVVSMGDMGDVAARIMPASPHEAVEPLLLQEAQAVFEDIASTKGTGKKALFCAGCCHGRRRVRPSIS